MDEKAPNLCGGKAITPSLKLNLRRCHKKTMKRGV